MALGAAHDGTSCRMRKGTRRMLDPFTSCEALNGRLAASSPGRSGSPELGCLGLGLRWSGGTGHNPRAGGRRGPGGSHSWTHLLVQRVLSAGGMAQAPRVLGVDCSNRRMRGPDGRDVCDGTLAAEGRPGSLRTGARCGRSRSVGSAALFAGRVLLSMIGPTALPHQRLETRHRVRVVLPLEPTGRCCIPFFAQRCAKSNRT
jgi:hypothetical protein